MDLQFDITTGFEADLAHFSPVEKKRIAASINEQGARFDPELGDATGRIFQPYAVVLPGGLDSSLYVLRVNERAVVILTIENDPLFHRVVWTLLRAVPPQELERAYRMVMAALYPLPPSVERKHG